MHRIGIAASKMARGNWWTYNFFVVLLSCIFSLFVFLICGFSVLLIIFLFFMGLSLVQAQDFHAVGLHMAKISLTILAIVVAIFTVIAIIKNIQYKAR